MGIKVTFRTYIKWLTNNLGVIAFLLILTSVLTAICSIYSTYTQACLFWAWSSLCLACSFVLHRYSLMVKSVKCLLLSFLEGLIVFVVAGHYLFGIYLLPQYSGPGLFAVMLLYYAVSLCVIIPEGKNHEWTMTQKTAMVVSLAIAVLAVGLVLFVPRWTIILILNIAALFLTRVFRMFTPKGICT